MDTCGDRTSVEQVWSGVYLISD